jgi:hypothetical protein
MSGIGFVGGAAAAAATPYTSGSYFMPDGVFATFNGGAAAAGTLRLMPGLIRRPVTIASLLAKVTTVAAGGSFQVALYKSDPLTNKPTGAPLYVSASQSTAVAALIEIAGVNLTVPAGLYWLAVQVDVTGAAAGFLSFNVAPNPLTMPQLVGFTAAADLFSAAPRGGYTKAGAFGVWPALTGNAATDGLAVDGTSATPAWAFKAA